MVPTISFDMLGWVAAALTLATFFSRDMLRMRTLALAANMAFIAFIAYGQRAPVAPRPR